HFFTIPPPPPRSTLLPYTTLFRSPVHPVLLRRRPTPRRDRRGRPGPQARLRVDVRGVPRSRRRRDARPPDPHARHLPPTQTHPRSEEHMSELQSRENLVCRLLLEK